MCRAKGFKDHGEYEVVKGFEAQMIDHTITAIFDPSADTETGFLSCFAEPQEAAEFLRPTSEGAPNRLIPIPPSLRRFTVGTYPLANVP